ncbi:Lrp/AsnC family transcriptional regulator [Brevibacterium sp. RIT 803]|uniref:Lrp/AsnC family transcriptional regulator n=1 Tax=Brevibacterium sp. RIT 803 TaxID=2810210 RepID=UPI0019504E9B|nr:Lrp/AsnC family transcriptional regulator [Brevibacterium sp. RIT 803]MBM6588902.1 Lrp/AsnC family transcriptional regulator [Brevibacterium sp. RIT 803]
MTIRRRMGIVLQYSEPAIDSLDRGVLKALRDNPRATMGEMAMAVGVSRTTFKARLDRLWDSGLIVGHETQLDLAALGLHVQAWVELNVHQGALAAIKEVLDGMPQVIEAFATTGGADVQCRIAARDTAHLQEMLLELSSCSSVTRTKSAVILSSLVSHRKVQALDLLDL